MAVIATDLSSTVEESLAACPQFRILIVGNSGVGKSSLISSIFNISLKDIDIAHDRAGAANVEFEYTSPENPRFILHDSQGFEPGKTSNWDTVERFLRTRSKAEDVREKVHAIWYGASSPQYEGVLRVPHIPKVVYRDTPNWDERRTNWGRKPLISCEGMYVEIPTVVVFMKFDLLVTEHFRRSHNPKLLKAEKLKASRESAEQEVKKRIGNSWSRKQVSCIPISTKPEYLGMLRELTDVTQKSLHELEEDTLLPWVAAQQMSARQKVEESIQDVKGQYWINMGQSTVFRGHRLIECLSRIGQDILKIWNFNDPENLLSNPHFFAQIVQLIDEFSPRSKGNDQSTPSPKYSDVASLADNIGSVLAQVLEFLYRTYRAIPETAQYLGAYIIDLTLVLHRVFVATVVMKTPRILSKELIDDELQKYRDLSVATIHTRIRGVSVGCVGFEQRVADLIRESLEEN